MKVLLSIKPEYAYKIFDGTKKYEFRRTIFKNKEIKKILVYASSPVQMVIGEFEIDSILNLKIKTLWEETSDLSGITEEFFFKYFEQKEDGYAIKIKNTIKYSVPQLLKENYNINPPQSYAYIK